MPVSFNNAKTVKQNCKLLQIDDEGETDIYALRMLNQYRENRESFPVFARLGMIFCRPFGLGRGSLRTPSIRKSTSLNVIELGKRVLIFVLILSIFASILDANN